LAAPAAASPAAIAIGVLHTISIKPAQRMIGIICSQLPSNGSFSLHSTGIEELYTSGPARVPGRLPAPKPPSTLGVIRRFLQDTA